MNGGGRRVVVVTGASRGAGKGIAIALGATGATVYVSGRSQQEGDAMLPGTIGATAAAVTAAGGQGVAVACDHRHDAQVAALFERVRDEQGGRIDILVNNACLIPPELTQPGPFWCKPLRMQQLFDVGMRSHYVASWHAAPLMAARGAGLIVHTSSYGSVCYMHGPAYGAQKAGIDKMAADMAVDFRGTGVATVSIWMGILLTDKLRAAFEGHPDALAGFAAQAETPEFTGHLIDALYRDPELGEMSGHTVIGAELGQRYGLADEGGRTPPSHREMLGEPRTPSSVVVR